MKLSRVAFIFGSLQQVSLANGENLLRGNQNVQNETSSNNIFASTTTTTTTTTTKGGRCKALIQVAENGDSPETLSPSCMLDDGTIVPIVGRESTFWEQKMESGEFSSGETQVTGCEFVQSFEEGGPAEECSIPPGDSSRFLSNLVNKNTDNQEENERRHLAVVTGKRTILVVRVIAKNRATTAGESALASAVFDDSINVAKQYKACSHGKLDFVKADDRSLTGTKNSGETDISNGVTTVRVNMSTSKGDSAMQNAITAGLNENFGVNSPGALADHVMYCLPAGTMWGAYAYVNHWLSVYNNKECEYLSGQMHEMGHNLNLGHANHKGSYEDETGMMGYSYSSTTGPKMCFNAAQSCQLGWYADKTVTLDKDNRSYIGSLGGIADYSDSDNTVLVKLDTGESTDYYVNFNRKSGFNSGVKEGGNQVTVVKGRGDESTGYAESELVAKLSGGKTYTIRNFDGTGMTATIQVHSIGTTARVSICIGACPLPSNSPTQSPTKSATPSSSPSLVPTLSPTESLAPSSSPSLAPSQTPSESLTPTQECLDSSNWRTTVRKRRRRQKKGCNWVKGKKSRCGKVGTGRVAARAACPVACGNCPA